MPRTTASLVCYKSSLSELEPLLQALMEDTSISKWLLVDNGAAENPEHGIHLRDLTQQYGGIYIAPSHNIGFGAGHNAALKALSGIPSDFHLMLNPDIVFDHKVLPALVEIMDERPAVGLIMPRVLYPDHTTQYLCKLLPTPLDFALRRFAPGLLQRLTRHRMDRYELRGMDSAQPGEVPFLSGCFMFTRRTALESIGGFDERYFLYMEDVDLCRRLATTSELLYWPAVSIAHRHERGSHKNLKLMLTHVRSAVLYFNKWGWLFDDARSKTNREALSRLTHTR
jgi:hypothetical protein